MKEKLDPIQEVLKALDTAEPKIDYSDRVEDTYDIKHAMAEMYASPGFRKFLMSNYNGAVKATVLGSKENFDYNRARAITFKEIFSRCRQSFENFERLRRREVSLRATEERFKQENDVTEHQEGSESGETPEAGSRGSNE